MIPLACEVANDFGQSMGRLKTLSETSDNSVKRSHPHERKKPQTLARLIE